MKFLTTLLPGVFLIQPDWREDERGGFARSFCRREFDVHGLNPHISQCNISFNRRRGTLRGLHYQADPYGEDKLVRCSAGAIYDVALDLRPHSPTYRRWMAEELTAINHHMLYIPVGVAHGFLTLQDDTEIFYQMSVPWHPETARGIRWNDPAFNVIWPEDEPIISVRDRTYSDFTP
ncbi:dTDP-4-dehydrorhamnose 3,5-epimerase [Ferrovum myxofaciens]|uniref:dTDP-4-dehydrorhamnose 3,5-epimerase n=1 Tax=Ferrovum myxofaciens TaxID=416213 RepID=A0A8F3DSQ2_9PROT|nr:dTDP-4-dehydrorhamnose 3,5-epimerase [Ferrovum myxofaciens]KXW57485.1 dTDP-4-dehydrorhamnose 3,5-epimerase [Ferrovum myxofaciens]QKE38614.1 MAG: dTDP-4-dehydrorhamnose 3,5-epimerase [Ferrovum myxofaciens]QWY73811.1 MAG: dTDP-4-dehydrorhamnose 3,5-epimerase [Ferrovum myxofaciens]QWY76565.1 MAG: dTDP-4-dehydrorhamnose 3,5-epimerase [Ferrovum myxofaciens]